MPFIPHTEQDVREMLAAIGAPSIEALFDEIPSSLRVSCLPDVPAGLSELEVMQLMSARARQDGQPRCFIGAGAYEHHIPAAVWSTVTRGEFYSAYTPYQAEASQGTLQTIYEYQTMIASLTGMEVSNASLYDGASAVAEAVLMAVRANRRSKAARILMPRTVHPHYRAVALATAGNQGVKFEDLPYERGMGHTPLEALAPFAGQDFTALVIAQPNFFGVFEDVDALTDFAHAHGALVIAVVNPTSLALLKPPGQWGQKGANIVVGEGQPLGCPLSSGGPYFGFMSTRLEHVRQMPGRVVGRTVDLDGRPGFTLTLQAREQHIRREKATSNICTNHALMALAATVYMARMGAGGMRRVAEVSVQRAHHLAARLLELDGLSLALPERPFLWEFALRVEGDAEGFAAGMRREGILAGLPLGRVDGLLADQLLVCCTETTAPSSIDRYVAAAARVMAAAGAAA